MAKTDFLSWDNDIDLDALLGEYTEDDDIALHQQKPPKDLSSDGYKCPICKKVLKTIAGFRGHVSKQHDKPHIKAHQHKVNGIAAQQIDSSQEISDVSHNLSGTFGSAFDLSLSNIANDPMHSLFGDSEVSAMCNVVSSLPGIQSFFLDTFSGIFSVGTNLCSALDREQLFSRFHQTRLSETFISGYMQQFGTLTFTSEGICDFVNILMMELISSVIKVQVQTGLQNSATDQQRLSDSDQGILFYICGFIVRSLRKRYHRVKSVCTSKKQCLDGLVLKTANSTFAGKFSKWTLKNDRGGLLIPCDEFFLLIREFETVIRHIVDLKNLSANSLRCDRLKENMMESFMVKHYSEKLFIEVEEDVKVAVVEDILDLFLTIRGYAITRMQRNKLAKEKEPKKQSAGLRQTLKDLSNK